MRISDWSSDGCSSDLDRVDLAEQLVEVAFLGDEGRRQDDGIHGHAHHGAGVEQAGQGGEAARTGGLARGKIDAAEQTETTDSLDDSMPAPGAAPFDRSSSVQGNDM